MNVDPIINVHLALLKAGAEAANNAARMIEGAPNPEKGNNGGRTRIIREALIVAQSAAASLNAAASIAALAEYRLATDVL